MTKVIAIAGEAGDDQGRFEFGFDDARSVTAEGADEWEEGRP